MSGDRLARLRRGGAGHNALNTRSVDIIFQTIPGVPDRNEGIQGLQFEVVAGGNVTQRGTSDANGRVRIRIPRVGNCTLRILGSEYEISIAGANLHSIEEVRGVQQRLTILGYYTDAIHGDNRRSDTWNNPNEDTERAMLNFQSDNNLFPDAMFGSSSVRALQRVMTRAGR